MGDCKVIRHREAFQGKQGLTYFSGISAETANARAICMHLLEMPPGATSKPHFHEAHETAIFMLEGTVEFRHGPNLEHLDRVDAGDFVYIPAGVPHQPYNPTDRVAKAVISRTDPNEQESVVLCDPGAKSSTGLPAKMRLSDPPAGAPSRAPPSRSR